jgi:hypothetical protein
MGVAFQPGAFQPVAFQTLSYDPIRVQARAGIAVAGLAPASYFIPNVVFIINGVDRSDGYVHFPSLSIDLAINDEPDQATFSIVSRSGLVPVAGQTVLIGLGDSNNLIFGGQIATVEHAFEPDGEPTPWVDVTCTDWSALANRRLVNWTWRTVTAYTIVFGIIGRYTSGFTMRSVSEASLSTVIDEFVSINEAPLTAMRRLVNLIGGGCYIDAHRDWHVWGPGGEVGNYVPTAPETLTGGLSTLKKFRHGYDDTQKRTRVIVEGAGTPLPVAIPVGADVATLGIPLTDEAVTHYSTIPSTPDTYARLGSLVVSYDHVEINLGPPSAVLYEAASPGATAVKVTAATNGISNWPFWLRDADGNHFHAADPVAPGGPYDAITGIPASGYGSIPVELAVGTVLYQAHHFEVVTPLTDSSTVEVAVDKDVSVTVRVQHDDPAAQAVIAAIEGGDGIHEYFVSDSNLTYTGCSQRAAAELDIFAATLPYAEWETQDLNAGPGSQQVINVTETGGLSVTVTIQRVSLSFPEPAMITGSEPLSFIGLPRRVCQGGTVKLQGLFEEIRG